MSDPSSSNELRQMLKDFSSEMKEVRNSNNNHISEVIGELRLDHNDMRDTIVELQKNGVTLTNICSNVEKAVDVMVDTLTKKADSIEKELRDFKREVYALTSVRYAEVTARRIDDLEVKASELKKVDRAQDLTLAQHGKWFFAGWVLFVATQVVLKYVPMFEK